MNCWYSLEPPLQAMFGAKIRKISQIINRKTDIPQAVKASSILRRRYPNGMYVQQTLWTVALPIVDTHFENIPYHRWEILHYKSTTLVSQEGTQGLPHCGYPSVSSSAKSRDNLKIPWHVVLKCGTLIRSKFWETIMQIIFFFFFFLFIRLEFCFLWREVNRR